MIIYMNRCCVCMIYLVEFYVSHFISSRNVQTSLCPNLFFYFELQPVSHIWTSIFYLFETSGCMSYDWYQSLLLYNIWTLKYSHLESLRMVSVYFPLTLYTFNRTPLVKCYICLNSSSSDTFTVTGRGSQEWFEWAREWWVKNPQGNSCDTSKCEVPPIGSVLDLRDCEVSLRNYKTVVTHVQDRDLYLSPDLCFLNKTFPYVYTWRTILGPWQDVRPLCRRLFRLFCPFPRVGSFCFCCLFTYKFDRPLLNYSLSYTCGGVLQRVSNESLMFPLLPLKDHLF